jgi:hypothetical protein
MEMNKKDVVSQIIGILTKHELNAKEVIEVLEETKDTYLQRSWHISINKKAD